MKYLYLMYRDGIRQRCLSVEQRRPIRIECNEFFRILAQSGRPYAAAALTESVGEISQLMGFAVLQARDLNEAIQLVARAPAVRYGHIEIHPVRCGRALG
jgi:hypothetical protein